MKNHPAIYEQYFIENDKQQLMYLTLEQTRVSVLPLHIYVSIKQLENIILLADLASKLVLQDYLRMVYILENCDPDDNIAILFLAYDVNYDQKIKPECLRNLAKMGVKANFDNILQVCVDMTDLGGFLSYELWYCICTKIVSHLASTNESSIEKTQRE